MSEAERSALKIPVGKVLSSEYCRTSETARLLDVGPVETTRDIMNMRAAQHVGGREAVIRRAQGVLSEPPPCGTNVIIVGHGNLMRTATDAYAGEAAARSWWGGKPKRGKTHGSVLDAMSTSKHEVKVLVAAYAAALKLSR